jgi:hypothetical protein
MSDENNKGVNEGILPPLNDTAIQTLFIISFLLLLLFEYILVIVYQYIRTYQQYRTNELIDKVQCDQVDYLIQLINEQERILSLLKRNNSSSNEEQLHSNNNSNINGITMDNKKLMDRYRILQHEFMEKKQRFVLSS